jgi:hypothetical protein
MAAKSGDRTAHWPAIEKKHGQPIDHWIGLVKAVPSGKYQDQIDVLRQEHGFSQAHANAVVMFACGSAATKRFGTLDDYLQGTDPAAAARTLRAIFAAITERFPDLELVLAWKQPMLKSGNGCVFGASVGKRHIRSHRGATATSAPSRRASSDSSSTRRRYASPLTGTSTRSCCRT